MRRYLPFLLAATLLVVGSPAAADYHPPHCECETVPECTKEIERHPTYHFPYGCRAALYEKEGQADKAIADYEKRLLYDDPFLQDEQHFLALKLGALYSAHGRHEEAIALYKDQADKGNLHAWDMLRDLTVPYTLPWSPFKIEAFPTMGWPKKPAVYGLSFGLLTADTGLLLGVQIAGLGVNVERAYGIQASVGTTAKSVAGVQAALFMSSAERVNGLQLAPRTQQSQKSWGIQAGGANFHRDISGLQVGIANISSEAKGLQVGGGNLSARTQGLQIGGVNGFGNKEIEIRQSRIQGLQIGLVNYSDQVDGAQIGFYNECRTLRGLQLGFVNGVTDSKRFGWLPFLRLSL